MVPMKLTSEERDLDDDQEMYRNEKQIMITHDQSPQPKEVHAYNQFSMGDFDDQHNDLNGYLINQLHSFRVASNNMRQYMNQRMNRLENNFDMNFYRDDEDHLNEQHYEPIEVEHYPQRVEEIRVDHITGNSDSFNNCSIFHNVQSTTSQNLQNIQQVQSVQVSDSSNNRRKSSVTNLMFMRVVDGNIITSI